LIANNAGRLGKNLWTEDSGGEPIALYAAFNEYDEARFVVERIRQWVEGGGRRSDTAVLYRSNAQSRVFEETFISMQIPYRVYGGLRFFERAEIKNALGYLRLLANRDDDGSFERVVNTPPRGIGERTVEVIRGLARESGLSLWHAARRIVTEQRLPRRACNALDAFLSLLENLAKDTAGLPLAALVDRVVGCSGLIDMYRNTKDGRGDERIGNLEELVSAARGFETVPEEFGDLDPVSAFLTQAALEAGEGQAEAWEDCVQLMTLHSAKGLEFPIVFLVGLEEDLFPHYLSSREPAGLEEERRLAYVGITRSRRQLYLSYAEKRRLHGSDTYPRPSRFLGEIPAELVRDVRARTIISRPVTVVPPGPGNAEGGWVPGQRVLHPRFGEGVVRRFEGSGAHARVQVNFTESGAKWLVVAYAKLEPVAG
jgi:DNA helicase-2/ATP-dependent DNA helicase PcrA